MSGSSPFQCPLRFRPIFKEKVWGGRQLETIWGKPLPEGLSIGESWEVSDHGDDLSVVAEGPFQGETLRDLIRRYPRELLGSAVRPFPLLFKAIDAAETLSVQLHPTDEDAALLAPGSLGKTEAWTIVHAEPGSRIVHGIAPEISREEFFEKIEALSSPGPGAGSAAPTSVEGLFKWMEVHRGDVIHLPAGTIHAIGAGIVLVEVQQSSDITYRIYDWGRPRELHLKKARRVSPPPERTPAPFHRWIPRGNERRNRWSVIRGRYFCIDALSLEPGESLRLVTAREGHPCFGVLVALAGNVCLETPGGLAKTRQGEFLLFPAAAEWARLLPGDSPFSGIWVQEG